MSKKNLTFSTNKMPLRNRKIPKLAKIIFQRIIPNNLLVENLKNPKLKFRPSEEFVEKMELNLPPTTPSGFEFPIKYENQLPFFVERTGSGSLPVYIDYKYCFLILTQEKEEVKQSQLSENTAEILKNYKKS